MSDVARLIEDAPVGSPGYPEEDTYAQGFAEGLRDAAAIVRQHDDDARKVLAQFVAEYDEDMTRHPSWLTIEAAREILR